MNKNKALHIITHFPYYFFRVLQMLRELGFSIVKSISFKLLNLLDPNFLSNISVKSINFKGIPLRDSSLEDKISSSVSRVTFERYPVCVLNDNNAPLSRDVIEYLLICIFEEKQLIDYILDRSTNQLYAGLSVEQVEKLLEYIITTEHTKNPNEAEPQKCLELLKKHKDRTLENKRAYSTKDRIRPSAVFWPDPTDKNNPRSLINELPYVNKYPFIDRTTPIISAGSCFATEIARHLSSNNYNYLIKEPNIAKDGSYWMADGSDREINASAAWGIIFNCPSFRQLVEKAFDERQLPKFLWSSQIEGRKCYNDPFRENVAFASPEAFEINYSIHKKAVRDAFLDAKVLVITPGLNEVWYFKADGSVFSRSPWRIAPSLIEYKVLTPEENFRDLQRMLDILRVHNPDLKIIITLSPIPLHATFLGDKNHVITANAHSKAVLRVAIEKFVSSNKDVYYFPSYEMISSCIKEPWLPDERHVSSDSVSTIMNLFGQMFYRD